MNNETKQGLFFSCAVGLQVAILLAICCQRAYTVATGAHCAVHAEIFDPNDTFRGDYLNLTYDMSNITNPSLKFGQEVFVVLKKESPFAVFESVNAKAPKVDANHFVLRGRVTQSFQGKVRIAYGIEHAYIPEGTGNTYNSKKGLVANIVIDNNGNALLESVIPVK